jgi:DNA-binding beta-propeller fold protein YncE
MKSALNALAAVAILAIAPQAHGSRADYLDRPLVEVAPRFYSRARMLDFPKEQRTAQYGVVGLPQAPVFHPYDLIGDDNLREGKLAPQFSFNLHLPQDFFEVLPAPVAARIAALSIPRGQVDIFWEVQDQPWNGDPLLFRPQYWTDPLAPNHGVYHQSRQLRAGIFDAPPGIHFRGHGPSDFVTENLSVHGPEHGPGTILSSPPAVLAMEGLDPSRTSSFWTLVTHGHRAAATLHVLLNDADQAALEAMAPRITSLRTLLGELEGAGSSLRGTPMAEKLRMLLRPSLWSASPEQELPAPAEGKAGKYQVLPCVPGAVVTGTCQVTTSGMIEGKALIGVRFDSDTEEGIGWGTALGQGQAVEGGSPSPRALSVRGIAPAGTTKALLFVQAYQGNPDARAQFREITFTASWPLWPGATAPALAFPANGAKAGVYHRLACVQGQTFTGTARVRTEGLGQGRALIGLRFETDSGELVSYGTAPGPGTTDQTPAGGSEAWLPLAVQGQAPEGATKVLVYVQVGQGLAGATAQFEGVAFSEAAGAAGATAPAPSGLWPHGSRSILAVPATTGKNGQYWAVACQAGDVFSGTCQVRSEDLTEGLAQICLRFDRDGTEGLAAGTPVCQMATPVGGSIAPTRLEVRGTVPPGATKALLYLQVVNGNPGASVTFDEVVFQKAPASGAASSSSSASAPSPAPAPPMAPTMAPSLMAPPPVASPMAPPPVASPMAPPPVAPPMAPPLSPSASSPSPQLSPSSSAQVAPDTIPGAPAPVLGIRTFKARKAVVAPGEEVDLDWTLGAAPASLSLTEAAQGVSTALAPSATTLRIAQLQRRAFYTLDAVTTDPATGGQVGSSAETSVGVQGTAPLAGDALHFQGAYANGHLGHGAAWRHLSGLLRVGGELFLAEGHDHTIRKLQLDDGALAPFAGVRAGAQENPRTALLRLNLPGPMAHLAPYLYVVDKGSHTIKRIPDHGHGPWLVIGTPGKAGLKDGPAGQAQFNNPVDIVADPDRKLLYVADRGNEAIRVLDANGHVTTLPVWRKPEGAHLARPAKAQIPGVQGLALHNGGELYVANADLSVIQLLKKETLAVGIRWYLTTAAGASGSPGFLDGPSDQARFNHPSGLAIRDDELLVADSGNNCIRRLRLNTHEVATLAGLPHAPAGHADGDRSEASFHAPSHLALGGPGELYVVDQGDRVLRKFGHDGLVSTVGGLGSASAAGAAGGPPTMARFNKPLGVVVDRAGVAYVADSANQVIRRVTRAGVVEVFAGTLETPGDADGPRQTARFQGPAELAMDAQGMLYVLEPAAQGRLRAIAPDGTVTTLPRGDGIPTLIAAYPFGGRSSYALARRTVDEDGVASTKVVIVRNGIETEVATGLTPVALAMDFRDNIYVITELRSYEMVAIHKFAAPAANPSDWREVATVALGPGATLGKAFGLPMIHGVATDSRGHLYLADQANGLVWNLDFDQKRGGRVAGAYPFLGPTVGAQPLDAPIFPPHRLAVTPSGDLLVTAGHAVLQITAPVTQDETETGPSAGLFQGQAGLGGSGSAATAGSGLNSVLQNLRGRVLPNGLAPAAAASSIPAGAGSAAGPQPAQEEDEWETH